MRMINYLKKEKVMTIALLLAILSAFIVHPDKQYIRYIDTRVLGLLFCLMVTVKGFQRIGVFDRAALTLLQKTSKSRTLIRLLIGICFFSSMFITNDVSLITFVPFTILVLKKCHLEQHIIYTIVMQTIAANLGSMLTPLGNPQNLYLYGISGFRLPEFLAITAPVTIAALLLILTTTFTIPDIPISISAQVFADTNSSGSATVNGRTEPACYVVLFVIDLIVVFHLIPWWIALIITILLVLLIKRSDLFWHVDYALLMSFVGFFIFVGNIGRIPMIRQAIVQMINGREILMSAIFSQFMSNVPAAILLSGFTTNIKALIIGTNIGGLGTLIASMASLISYKIYVETPGSYKGIYVRVFTLYNVLGLLILLAFSYLWF